MTRFGALVISVLVSQAPGTTVVFEVAAVRQNKSGQIAAQIDDLPGGRFVATNATARMLIREAYRIPDKQLLDAPDWTQTERFDVNAKLEREAPIVRGDAGERQLALQSLLAERFKLRVHRETRQVPMFALVMARADRNRDRYCNHRRRTAPPKECARGPMRHRQADRPQGCVERGRQPGDSSLEAG